MKDRIKSFGYAIRGFELVLKSEMNMKIHTVSAISVIIAGIYFKLNPTEWALILICIAMVLAAEIGNTVIEKFLDAYHPERSSVVGALKDMAAAAVLVLASFSGIVGLIIFIPKLIALT